MQNKTTRRISFNSPAVLLFCALCLIAMVLNIISGGLTNDMVFSVYRSSLLSPLTYVRMVGHVFGHADWSHFFGNIMYILLLGPMLEEKYGTSNIVFVMLATALVTGIICFVFFPHLAMLGASGIVFSMILLSSFTNTEGDGIPLTFILVAFLYIGQQIYEAVLFPENIAYFSHIAGGAVGALLGAVMQKHNMSRYSHRQ